VIRYFSRLFRKRLPTHTAMVSLVRQAGSDSALPRLLAPKVKQFIQEKAALCQPDRIHVCDGSEAENVSLLQGMQKEGLALRVSGKYENWYVL
jgi:phosphoenolpyruvate carboxykinase (GTP)